MRRRVRLLLTDDGDLAHRLLHPRFGVEKTYRAADRRTALGAKTSSLRDGVALDEFRAAAAKVRVVCGAPRPVASLT